MPATIAKELNRCLGEVLGQTTVNASGSVRQCAAAHLPGLASGRQRPGGRLMAHGPGPGSGACCPAGVGVSEPAR